MTVIDCYTGVSQAGANLTSLAPVLSTSVQAGLRSSLAKSKTAVALVNGSGAVPADAAAVRTGADSPSAAATRQACEASSREASEAAWKQWSSQALAPPRQAARLATTTGT